jgi:hypothetical protein
MASTYAGFKKFLGHRVRPNSAVEVSNSYNQDENRLWHVRLAHCLVVISSKT